MTGRRFATLDVVTATPPAAEGLDADAIALEIAIAAGALDAVEIADEAVVIARGHLRV